MKRLMVLLAVVTLAVLAFSSSAAMAEHGGYHAVNPCMGGCDAEYWDILTYDPYEMWETYGYPTHILYQSDPPRGCWWYDGRDIDGVWWYMCPPDGNLYPYEEDAA